MEKESEKMCDTSEPSSSKQETSITSRIGMCEVCAGNAAKYTCPRCEVKTCSIRCVRIHKQEVECNGERDKTKFIPLNKFTNFDVSSDYRLLEEMTRNVILLKKNPLVKQNRSNKALPTQLFKLHKAAAARKTIIKFLPRSFKRHTENTTYLHYKSNMVYWHIDWVFVNADNLKLVDTNVPETAKLSNVFHKYLNKQEDKNIQEKLQYYQAVNMPGIKLFLKAEQKAGCKYYELDPLETVKDCLKNKIIIEYPTIHVVLKQHAELYDVIDSDDENEDMDVDVKPVNGNVIVNRIVNKAEKEELIDSTLKNLLFISEVSEGETSDLE